MPDYLLWTAMMCAPDWFFLAAGWTSLAALLWAYLALGILAISSGGRGGKDKADIRRSREDGRVGT